MPAKLSCHLFHLCIRPQVIAKGISEEDADILEEHLNGAVSKLHFQATKSCGVSVDANGFASEPSGGTTHFNRQIFEAINKGYLSGGRATRLIPVMDILVKRCF
jgi:hypothetical protein